MTDTCRSCGAQVERDARACPRCQMPRGLWMLPSAPVVPAPTPDAGPPPPPDLGPPLVPEPPPIVIPTFAPPPLPAPASIGDPSSPSVGPAAPPGRRARGPILEPLEPPPPPPPPPVEEAAVWLPPTPRRPTPAPAARRPGAASGVRALALVAAVVGVGVAVLAAVVGSVTDGRRGDTGSGTIATTVLAEPTTAEVAGASGFVTIHDDQNLLSVDVPVEWDEIEGLPDSVGDPTLDASTDLERFKRSFAVPGLSIAILGRGTAPTVEGRMGELLDQLGAIEACPTPVGEQGDDVRYLVARSDCEGQDFDLTVMLEALDSGDDLAVLVQTASARSATVTPVVFSTFRYDD